MRNFSVATMISNNDSENDGYESDVVVKLAEEVSEERVEIVTKWCAGVVGDFLRGQFLTADVTVMIKSYSDDNDPALLAAAADTLAAAEAADAK